MIEIRAQGRRNNSDSSRDISPQVKIDSSSRRRKGWLRNKQDIREAKLESKLLYLLGRPAKLPREGN